MRYKPFNHFLRSEAQEHEGGGGAAAAATPAAAAETPAVPATETPAAATPPREPSRLEKISAAIQTKSAILAESAGLRGQVETLTATLGERDGTITTLQARVKVLEGENQQLAAELEKVDTALKSTEANVVSIDTAAARQIAGMGFEAPHLPAAETAAPSVEALLAKMNATTDPDEKYRIAAQINKIEAEN